MSLSIFTYWVFAYPVINVYYILISMLFTCTVVWIYQLVANCLHYHILVVKLNKCIPLQKSFFYTFAQNSFNRINDTQYITIINRITVDSFSLVDHDQICLNSFWFLEDKRAENKMTSLWVNSTKQCGRKNQKYVYD